LNVSFDGCPSFVTCEQMDRLGFAISAGAACLSGEVKPSANILAMGLSESRARTSVRISLGHSNSERQIVTAGDAFATAIKRVRAAS
jgi:cysteine desulfurase